LHLDWMLRGESFTLPFAKYTKAYSKG
jgi:hypothetical protein